MSSDTLLLACVLYCAERAGPEGIHKDDLSEQVNNLTAAERLTAWTRWLQRKRPDDA